MATTWMKALHRSGGGVAAALDLRVEYAKDYTKTEDGALIDSYGCDSYTAQSEFLFSKRLYEQRTGRDQGKHDVIAYHVRMSFKPGEVTPQQALELGKELALRWTKGRHQFIVAAHTNTNNPHAHIIFNSVNLDCDRKFVDFKRSAIVLRKVSDRVCLEHGLSVIEKPGLSKGYNRNEYLGDNKPPTVRDRLREIMDTALIGCKDYGGFLAALQAAGVEIKRGKQLAFRLPGGKKFSRQDTLGEDYSSDAIREKIAGKRIVAPRKKIVTPVAASAKPNLLIDIQEKMNQGYGEGFRHWATGQNLQDMAKTLIFLQEHGLDNYELLSEKTVAATNTFNSHSDQIKEIEADLKGIAELQRHIGNYGKTHEVYKQYRVLAPKKREKFFEEHRMEITLHRAAKEHFDSLGLQKLPPMDSLRKEYAVNDAKKKKLYRDFKPERDEMISLQRAKHNVDMFLGIPRELPSKTQQRDER